MKVMSWKPDLILIQAYIYSGPGLNTELMANIFKGFDILISDC